MTGLFELKVGDDYSYKMTYPGPDGKKITVTSKPENKEITVPPTAEGPLEPEPETIEELSEVEPVESIEPTSETPQPVEEILDIALDEQAITETDITPPGTDKKSLFQKVTETAKNHAAKILLAGMALGAGYEIKQHYATPVAQAPIQVAVTQDSKPNQEIAKLTELIKTQANSISSLKDKLENLEDKTKKESVVLRVPDQVQVNYIMEECGLETYAVTAERLQDQKITDEFVRTVTSICEQKGIPKVSEVRFYVKKHPYFARKLAESLPEAIANDVYEKCPEITEQPNTPMLTSAVAPKAESGEVKAPAADPAQAWSELEAALKDTDGTPMPGYSNTFSWKSKFEAMKGSYNTDGCKALYKAFADEMNNCLAENVTGNKSFDKQSNTETAEKNIAIWIGKYETAKESFKKWMEAESGVEVDK